jgi:hypothetical protein
MTLAGSISTLFFQKPCVFTAEETQVTIIMHGLKNLLQCHLPMVCKQICEDETMITKVFQQKKLILKHTLYK